MTEAEFRDLKPGDVIEWWPPDGNHPGARTVTAVLESDGDYRVATVGSVYYGVSMSAAHCWRKVEGSEPSDAKRIEQLTADLGDANDALDNARADLGDANDRIAELEERLSEAVCYLRPLVDRFSEWERMATDDQDHMGVAPGNRESWGGHGGAPSGRMRAARTFLASLDAGEDAPSCACGGACGPANAGETPDTGATTNEAPAGSGEAEQGEAVELPYCVAQSYGGWTVRNTLTGSMSGWWSRCEEAEEDAQRANLRAISGWDVPHTGEATNEATGGAEGPQGLAAIVGQWPGDETDEEIEDALRGLRGLPTADDRALDAKLRSLGEVCRIGRVSPALAALCGARMVDGHRRYGADASDLDLDSETLEELCDAVCYTSFRGRLTRRQVRAVRLLARAARLLGVA